MKTKVISVYLTFALTLVSLTAVCVLFVNSFNGQQLLLNIGYGVFGSSLVSFMICLFEYFNVKKQTLDDFYLSSLDYLNAVRNVLFFDIDDEELLISKLLVMKNVDDVELLRLIRSEKCPFSSKVKSMTNEKALVFIRGRISEFSYNLKKTVGSFISFVKTDTNSLSRLIGQIHFLNPFCKYKRKIYSFLYEPMINTLALVNKHSFYFYPYLLGEPVILSDIVDGISFSNKIFFEKKEIDGTFYVWTIFENTLFDELEKYRCFIYHKKYVPVEHKSAYQSLNLKW